MKNVPSSSTLYFVQGYLKKKKAKKRWQWLLPMYTKRWFILDFLTNSLYYTRRQTACRIRRIIPFADIIGYSAEYPETYPGTWRFLISLQTTRRTYSLFCATYEEFDTWTRGFQQSSGLAPERPLHASLVGDEPQRLGIDVFLCDAPPSSKRFTQRRATIQSESTLSATSDYLNPV